ncbi:MAG: hypothetical protein RL757_1414 [Bacteroidota bacterium]|jgi:deoxyribonuclease V
MIIAIDVHYREDEAKIVGVFFENWTDENAAYVRETFKTDVAEYESGAFYKRELPCILQILNEIDLQNVEIIVIDGYVFLDDFQKAGLGFHLFEALAQQKIVIGVAKTSFHQNSRYVKPVFRGESERPIFVSAIGMELDEAAQHIHEMYGAFRMPKLLQELDSLTKS